jgi:hypothetical protein
MVINDKNHTKIEDRSYKLPRYGDATQVELGTVDCCVAVTFDDAT